MSSNNRRGLLALGLLVAGPAAALESDQRAQVQVRAERIDIDQKTGISRYQGGVRYQQGSMVLTANHAEILMSRQTRQAERLTADGRPTRFRVEVEEEPHEIRGQARRLSYDAGTGELLLLGAVRLERGTDHVVAGQLRYDTRGDHFTAAQSEGQRVQAHFQPPAATPEATAPAAPARKPGKRKP